MSRQLLHWRILIGTICKIVRHPKVWP